MKSKLSKIVKQLYDFLDCLQFRFDNTLLQKKKLSKKYIQINYFLSKNIISFINCQNFDKQLTGLTLKSYINLIELILLFGRFFFTRCLSKLNPHIYYLILRITLSCFLIFIILRKIFLFFFLKIVIINKNFIPVKIKKFSLLFNFPQHSLEKRKSINYPSSFYENIIYKRNKANLKFLSFGDYQRTSKEGLLKKNYLHISRAKSQFSLRNFFVSFFFFFRSNNKFYQNNLPFEINLLNLSNLLTANYYEFIVKFVERKYEIRINKIFFIMFNNPFYYFHNYSIKSSVYEFFYAENIFVPALESLKINYKYKYFDKVNFRLWSLTNHGLGFSRNLETINFIQKKYFLFLQKNLIFKNYDFNVMPSPLGYENIVNLKGKRNIVIFDTKPYYNDDENIKNNPIIDIFSSEYFINKFNDDIFSVLENTNYNFYLKPKYSLNYKVNVNYKKQLIENLKKCKKFKVIDPYSNLVVLSKNISLSISIPFTSTFKIMNNLGVPSKYYCPDDFKHFFKKNYSNKNILFGKKSLLNWVNYKLK